MGMNEIDHTIYPYTVGREDCKVLPRSFKSLGEAEAYFAKQDKGALSAASSISTDRSRTTQRPTVPLAMFERLQHWHDVCCLSCGPPVSTDAHCLCS